jgi:hypothetical protein
MDAKRTIIVAEGGETGKLWKKWARGSVGCGTRILRLIHGRDARATLVRLSAKREQLLGQGVDWMKLRASAAVRTGRPRSQQ